MLFDLVVEWGGWLCLLVLRIMLALMLFHEEDKVSLFDMIVYFASVVVFLTVGSCSVALEGMGLKIDFMLYIGTRRFW